MTLAYEHMRDGLPEGPFRCVVDGPFTKRSGLYMRIVVDGRRHVCAFDTYTMHVAAGTLARLVAMLRSGRATAVAVDGRRSALADSGRALTHAHDSQLARFFYGDPSCHT